MENQLKFESTRGERNNFFATLLYFSLQCFDTVGWAAGRASGL